MDAFVGQVHIQAYISLQYYVHMLYSTNGRDNKCETTTYVGISGGSIGKKRGATGWHRGAPGYTRFPSYLAAPKIRNVSKL